MSGESDAATRRIMNQFGEESRIPYLNIEEGDVGVLIAAPIAGLFVAGLAGVESLALPLVAAGFGLGVAVIVVTPDHVDASTWLVSVARYVRRPRVTFNAPAADENGESDTPPRNEGGVANYTPFAPDERTQDLTNVERAWPGAGAIQRSDGTMEAYLEIQPGNMDFAMSDDWAALQELGASFANNELDFPLTVHATTRPFPVERLVEQLDDRLSDEDVTNNPIFRALLEEYRETRPSEMQDRGIQELHYYLGVEVTPLEVYNRYRDEGTPVEKLVDIPGVGVLFTPFVTRRADLTEAELRAQLFEKLDDRLGTVRSDLVQPAPGWSARRLSTVELFVLNMEFWNGDEHEYATPEDVVREQPIVGRSPREDDSHA